MVKIVGDKILLIQNTLFVGVITILQRKKIKKIRKGKGKARVDGDSDKQLTERTPRKCFRYGSADHLIDKSPEPSQD